MEAKKNGKSNIRKFFAVYGTMVVVGTLTIAFLEHTSFLCAFRTALIAAVGKTVAVSVVGSCFED